MKQIDKKILLLVNDEIFCYKGSRDCSLAGEYVGKEYIKAIWLTKRLYYIHSGHFGVFYLEETMSDVYDDIDECLGRDWRSDLEKNYIQNFLRGKGHDLSEWDTLSEDLKVEACQHASLVQAEMQARARFTDQIRLPP